MLRGSDYDNGYSEKRPRSPSPEDGAYDSKRQYNNERGISVEHIKLTLGEGSQEQEQITIPSKFAGLVIGRGGDTLKTIQNSTGTRISVEESENPDERKVTFTGSRVGIEEAINQVMNMTKELDDRDEERLKVPSRYVGLIVGMKASTLKEIQMKTGAKLRVPPVHELPEDERDSEERTIYLSGSEECKQRAKDKINQIIESAGTARRDRSDRGPGGRGDYDRPPRDLDYERNDRQHDRRAPPAEDDYYPPPPPAAPSGGRREDGHGRFQRVTVETPKDYAKVIIGRGGENITYLKNTASVKIFVEQKEEESVAQVHISGDPDSIIHAQRLMNSLLERNGLRPVDMVPVPGADNAAPRNDYSRPSSGRDIQSTRSYAPQFDRPPPRDYDYNYNVPPRAAVPERDPYAAYDPYAAPPPRPRDYDRGYIPDGRDYRQEKPAPYVDDYYGKPPPARSDYGSEPRSDRRPPSQGIPGDYYRPNDQRPRAGSDVRDDPYRAPPPPHSGYDYPPPRREAADYGRPRDAYAPAPRHPGNDYPRGRDDYAPSAPPNRRPPPRGPRDEFNSTRRPLKDN
ncbi:hypothetical protein MP638_006200 [Amoeboaphelidium occidentale]|nr:hypothetical protein MP638_006200 [Amoeboaphelidium occidentale]